ncbi:MAG: hypothetical protein EpisKO_15800 [Epibacterium sp.]
MTTLTRARIRALCDCPKCGATMNEPCRYDGKGSQKAHRVGKNHHERMHLAQAILAETETFDDEVLE